MIAVHKVRHYGEAVAVVVAEDRYIAEDACDLIDVVYEPLPAVLDPFAASDEGAPLLHDALGTNVAYERTFTFGDVDGTFERAPRKVQARLRWPRSTAMPMDTNGAIGDFDRGTGVVTVWANSMNFTYFQWLLAACLKVPTSKLNVLPVAAGGSFGSKFFMHKVPCLAGFLSKLVGRPVKYVEDRIDHIVNNDHAGSDRHYDAELAFDDDGTFLALRIRVVDDYGAYLQFGTGTHGNSLSQIVGPYRIGEVEYSLQAVLTNKNQQGAYRGFGAEVSNWVLERLVDFAARDLGVDRVELRRRNLIGADEFPYRTPTGNIYDSGNYAGVVEKILEASDYAGWVAERDRARAEGRHIGIGVVASQERSVFSSTEFWFWFDKPSFTPTSSPESASLQIDPTGQITVTLHSQAMWGNSPETVVSQVVAEEFDVDPASVLVTYADSQHALPGTGPGGSRFTVMVSGAVAGAAGEVKAKMRRIVAHKLEVSEEDLEFRDGGVSVVGSPDRAMSISDIALTAYMFHLDLPAGMESGLAAQSTYDHPLTTLPNDDRSDLGIFYPFVGHAWHIAVVEVDVETGKVTFLRYAAVHDAGHDRQSQDARRPGHRRHGAGARHGAVRGVPLRRRGPRAQRDVRVLPPALVDGRALDHRRASGDAVALHRLRDQGRRGGRAHAEPGDHERRDRGRAVGPRRADHVPADLGGADRGLGGGGRRSAAVELHPLDRRGRDLGEVDQGGRVLAGERAGRLVEDLDRTQGRAVERGERGREPPAQRRLPDRGPEGRQLGEVLAGRTGRTVAVAQQLVDRGQVQPADERPPADVVLRVRRGACTVRDRHDAAVRVQELARLLGDELEHLLECVVGVARERRVGEERGQLPRQLGPAATLHRGLLRLGEPALDHLERRQPLQVEVTRGAGHPLDVGGVRGACERRHERLLVRDRQVEHAELPAHGVAGELVRREQRGLARLAQVVVERGRVRRAEGLEDGGHDRSPR